MDGVHDMGGMHGFGQVVAPGEDVPYHERWEARVFAIHMLISTERLGAGPGGRPTREEMAPAHYLEASYYERWLWSAERRLERGGTIAPGEIERMMDRLAEGQPEPRRADPELAERTIDVLRQDLDRLVPPDRARFAPGDPVQVRRMRPRGHARCPRYARGVRGFVDAVRGADALPDLEVYGQDAPVEPVYSVAFRSTDLWGAGQEPAYAVYLDLWESYLEAA